ncbi:MAG: amidohydrolase [Treponema sp.]|jgi:5-methylthioadenosine/S-adenosylhomocysteine deaminase|nr:amidohydrolase [Treponema sp.]
MEILFSDIIVLTMNDEQPVLKHGYVGIDGKKISYIGEKPPADSKAIRVINGGRRLLMPGLINSHSHLPMALLRGYADDYRLQEWLFNHVLPAEGKLDERAVAAGIRLGMAECFRFGVISCTDMYFHIPHIAEAVLGSGTKANITNALLCLDMDKFDFEKDRGTMEVREVLARYKERSPNGGVGDGRLIVDAGIHAEYTSGPAAWQASVAFAAENNLRIHVHISESEHEHTECVKRYGKTPTEILHESRVFSRKTTAAHCCWLTENDMDILAANGATAVHCPISNLKLSSGIAPVMKMRAHGLNVALGTDGVCSNNNHDMFEEIKTAALLQKYLTGDPTALPAYEAIKLATVNGALGQGRENETGRIKVGFDADLIMLNLDAPHLFPLNDPFAAVAYAARGSDVCMTMVQGHILYENGEHKTIDLEKTRHEVESYVLPLLG